MANAQKLFNPKVISFRQSYVFRFKLLIYEKILTALVYCKIDNIVFKVDINIYNFS